VVALAAGVAVACGAVAAPEPADADAGPDVEATTRCAIDIAGETTRITIAERINLTASSNGSGCSLRVGGSEVVRDCGGSVTFTGRELGSGHHALSLTVEDGPGGFAVCERSVVVVYPGPCTTQWDYARDGTIDRLDVNEFDDLGRNVRQDADLDGDGSTDYVVRTWWDGASRYRLLSQRVDVGADGLDDERISWIYSAEQRLRATELDRGIDGSVDVWTEFLYDASGSLQMRQEDHGVDGAFDGFAYFTIGTYGELEQVREDRDGNGVIDNTWNYENDELGNQLGVGWDATGDGVVDHMASHDHSCWE
jgi:hypothetical protein